MKYIKNIFLTVIVLITMLVVLAPAGVQAAPTILPALLPNGQVGVPYSAIISATCNGTCNWSLSGGFLPPGLLMSGGIIQGTPTTAGTFPFSLTVTDSTGSASQNYSITVVIPPLTFSSTSLSQSISGQPYSGTVSATGGTGTITYAITSGGLPPGLTMSSSGQITGTVARGSTGVYTFTVTATAGTSTAQQSFSIIVEKGTYDAKVSISSGLAEGQTRLYVNNVLMATLRGGETASLKKLDPDAIATVSVDSVVTPASRTDVRYKAEASTASLSEGVGHIRFNYFAEYYIEFKSDPSGIGNVPGSNWYREGAPITVTAPEGIDRDTDSQYRFAYWLAPGGDKARTATLNVAVTGPAKYIATYEVYIRFTVATQYGSAQGSGWYKLGNTAKWSVSPPEVAMPGVLGFFGGKYKALLTSGSEIIDGPKTITIQWDPDYGIPAVTIPVTILVIAGAIYAFYSLYKRSQRPHPIPYGPPMHAPPPPPYSYPPPPQQFPPAPPAPAMPPPQTTVVMIGDALKKTPGSTREQLLEKFSELLQKYEDEISQGKELSSTPELQEMGPVLEKKSLPAPDVITTVTSPAEKPAPVEECGFGTNKLLRTVVTGWRNTDVKPITVIPGDKKSAALAGGRTVTWTREKYNEWELHICKLPAGHKSTHKGSTEIVYSLLDTITEERNYSPKQPMKPPVPHYTDGMPEIEIPAGQIIASDQLPI